MSKATPERIAELEEVLNTSAAGLAKLTTRRMFGCHALFANEVVFGLVWKEGRLGVRLPDVDLYTQLMSAKGASPWKAGPMVMSHWVLVPESMHKASGKLKEWLALAHGLALSTEKKPKAKTKVVSGAVKKAVSKRKAPVTKAKSIKKKKKS